MRDSQLRGCTGVSARNRNLMLPRCLPYIFISLNMLKFLKINIKTSLNQNTSAQLHFTHTIRNEFYFYEVLLIWNDLWIYRCCIVINLNLNLVFFSCQISRVLYGICSAYIHSFERIVSQIFNDVFDNFVRFKLFQLVAKTWKNVLKITNFHLSWIH